MHVYTVYVDKSMQNDIKRWTGKSMQDGKAWLFLVVVRCSDHWLTSGQIQWPLVPYGSDIVTTDVTCVVQHEHNENRSSASHLRKHSDTICMFSSAQHIQI